MAISTACGGLDNLVTDTISVGQACIEHLRKNDLGRANVMCLDRIAARDMSPVQTPENAPRLFDLITVKDPKFAPAFFQLLTNTLVAIDLDQGKRLAFGAGNKRWRVVTLDGQLIDVSGTMSGGGGRPAKGKMSSKIVADEVSPELVAKCEQEQQVAVEALRVFADGRQKVDRDLTLLSKRLPEIDLAISKAEMDLTTGKKRREEAEKRLAELRWVPDFALSPRLRLTRLQSSQRTEEARRRRRQEDRAVRQGRRLALEGTRSASEAVFRHRRQDQGSPGEDPRSRRRQAPQPADQGARSQGSDRPRQRPPHQVGSRARQVGEGRRQAHQVDRIE